MSSNRCPSSTTVWSGVAIATSLVLLFSMPVRASEDDSSSQADSWPVFRGNPQMTGVAGSSLAAEPKLLWAFQAGGDIESTAAIAGGAVYFGAFDSKLYSIDLATGKQNWTYTAESEIQSSPSIDRGVVFFGDAYGVFHAVDAATGKGKWKFETQAEIVSSATFDGERVLFGSYDQYLYALDRRDGSLVWKVETEGYVHATPAIIGRTTTVSGCDGFLWLIHLDDGRVVDRIDLAGQAGATPAVLGNVAFVATYENQVRAIDVVERKTLWAYEHPKRKFPYYASAAVTEKAVVVGGRDKILRALDPKTGESQWEWNTGGRIDSSPVIVGDRAFFGSTRGEVIAVSVATGEVVWKYETGSAIVASPSVAAGRLVIGTVDGALLAFGDR